MSSDTQPGRGQLLVVSSPSGAGKSTLCKRLRQEFADLDFSVSFTTRAPRTGEVDGREYHFIDQDRFQEMIARDEFAEYALVHGNMYGTSAETVETALDSGRDLIFDIDFQGGRSLQRRFADDVVLIFILPPSLSELERRLRSRATDSDEVIEKRLKVARSEMEHYDLYDYVIVNDDLDKAYDALRGIYVACRHRRERTGHLAEALLRGQELA
jgi:guanylate kinase